MNKYNQKCPKGHVLKFMRENPQRRSYPCDKCRKSFDYPKGLFHCKDCDEVYHTSCLNKNQ